MSYVAEIEIPKKQWGVLQKEMKRLPVTASRAGQVVLKRIAHVFFIDIKKRYRSMYNPPLKASSIERRKHGMPSYSGTKPLQRSGRLVKLVKIKQKVTGRHYTAQVRIAPNRLMSGGGVSHKVAWNNEFGRPYSMEITDKMIAYLRNLLKKSGRYAEVMGKSRNKPPNAKGYIQGWIRARPVWVPAIHQLTAKQPKDFAIRFIRELNRTHHALYFDLTKVF